MGVLHIKLSEVSLQQTGRRLFGLQGGGLPPDAQDPKKRTKKTPFFVAHLIKFNHTEPVRGISVLQTNTRKRGSWRFFMAKSIRTFLNDFSESFTFKGL